MRAGPSVELPAETSFTMTDGYARIVTSKLSQFFNAQGLAAGGARLSLRN
jgi:hypothetical protein